MLFRSIAILCQVLALGDAFSPSVVVFKPTTTKPTTLKATAVDAISSLKSSQATTVEKIASSIPDLEIKSDFTWTDGDGIAIGGNPCTLDARDAPGPANVAWLSAVSVDSKLCGLTIFNGPLTDVPHMVSRVVLVDDSTMRFTLDFRPRAYGAYEMRRPDGTYPGPDELGRKSFEYSGAR
jgi:hypothetical protein